MSNFSGVLVNLHHGDADGCGLVNIDAIQQVVAAKWAVDVINNQSLPHELKIGEFLLFMGGNLPAETTHCTQNGDEKLENERKEHNNNGGWQQQHQVRPRF